MASMSSMSSMSSDEKFEKLFEAIAGLRDELKDHTQKRDERLNMIEKQLEDQPRKLEQRVEACVKEEVADMQNAFKTFKKEVRRQTQTSMQSGSSRQSLASVLDARADQENNDAFAKLRKRYTKNTMALQASVTHLTLAQSNKEIAFENVDRSSSAALFDWATNCKRQVITNNNPAYALDAHRAGVTNRALFQKFTPADRAAIHTAAIASIRAENGFDSEEHDSDDDAIQTAEDHFNTYLNTRSTDSFLALAHVELFGDEMNGKLAERDLNKIQFDENGRIGDMREQVTSYMRNHSHYMGNTAAFAKRVLEAYPSSYQQAFRDGLVGKTHVRGFFKALEIVTMMEDIHSRRLEQVESYQHTPGAARRESSYPRPPGAAVFPVMQQSYLQSRAPIVPLPPGARPLSDPASPPTLRSQVVMLAHCTGPVHPAVDYFDMYAQDSYFRTPMDSEDKFNNAVLLINKAAQDCRAQIPAGELSAMEDNAIHAIQQDTILMMDSNRLCWDCQQPDHLAGDPRCPKPSMKTKERLAKQQAYAATHGPLGSGYQRTSPYRPQAQPRATCALALTGPDHIQAPPSFSDWLQPYAG